MPANMQCPRRDEKYHRHGPSTVPKDADDGGERLKGVARHKKPAASLLARPSTFYHGYPIVTDVATSRLHKRSLA